MRYLSYGMTIKTLLVGSAVAGAGYGGYHWYQHRQAVQPIRVPPPVRVQPLPVEDWRRRR